MSHEDDAIVQRRCASAPLPAGESLSPSFHVFRNTPGMPAATKAQHTVLRNARCIKSSLSPDLRRAGVRPNRQFALSKRPGSLLFQYGANVVIKAGFREVCQSEVPSLLYGSIRKLQKISGCRCPARVCGGKKCCGRRDPPRYFVTRDVEGWPGFSLMLCIA